MTGVAVVGAGYIGQIHLETLNRLSGVQVVTVYDKDRSLAEKAAADHRLGSVAGSFEALLANPAVDAIHICTPNSLHFEQACAALDAGKQVFCEKPLALTSDQGRILTEKAAARGAVTGIGFCYRYYPVVQELALRVRRGDFGNVRMVSGTWFQDWLSEVSDYTWRLDKDQSGASNVAADLGSHWFDLIQFVTGLHVSDVLADFHTIIPERQKPRKEVLAFQAGASGETETVAIAYHQPGLPRQEERYGIPGVLQRWFGRLEPQAIQRTLDRQAPRSQRNFDRKSPGDGCFAQGLCIPAGRASPWIPRRHAEHAP